MNPSNQSLSSSSSAPTNAPPSVTFDELRRSALTFINLLEATRSPQGKSIFSGVWGLLWPTAGAAPPEPTRAEPRIEINPGVVVAPEAVSQLRELLLDAGLSSATITSGQRTVEQQAQVMYTNLVALGVPSQRSLYRTSGNRVIDEFERAKREGKTPDQVRAAMVTTMLEIGPTNVSNHINPKFHTFDVSTASIDNANAFVAALERAEKAGKVSKHINEGRDMAFHIELERTGI